MAEAERHLEIEDCQPVNGLHRPTQMQLAQTQRPWCNAWQGEAAAGHKCEPRHLPRLRD